MTEPGAGQPAAATPPPVPSPAGGGGPRWPANPIGWAGLALLGAMALWLAWKGQVESAGLVVGLICWMLGMDRKQAAAAAFSFRAAVNSAQAAVHSADASQAATEAKDVAIEATQAASRAASTAAVVREAVRDIQDNPAGPGTPGWMDRHTPRG